MAKNPWSIAEAKPEREQPTYPAGVWDGKYKMWRYEDT